MTDMPNSIASLLAGNPYPGRGITVGMSADGRYAVWAYFIMGRSDNSRNRVLQKEGASLFTRPYDSSKVQDPTLIIYRAAEQITNGAIVTNGDQTDTIRDALAAGRTFADALERRTYEPDAPNYTPRISALLEWEAVPKYTMSILKRDADGTCNRQQWHYTMRQGTGHIIHTYQTDGNPLPSFEGAPKACAIPNEPRALGDAMWEALDADNKIALYVCYVDVQNGQILDALYNKHQPKEN